MDLETGAVVAVTIAPADQGDPATMRETLAQAGERIAETACEANNDEAGEVVDSDGPANVVADKGYHSNDVLVALEQVQVRSYVSEPDRGRRKWDGKVEAKSAVYGKPLLPVEERPVPKSDAEGEQASPTQPFPVVPKPLVHHRFEVWGPTPEAKAWCAEQVAKLRYDGVFTPPSTRGSLLFPGNVGGLHWGGVTYDKANQLIIAPVNNLAAVARLIPRAEFEGERRSDRLGLEFAPQSGTPYGMARQILRSPSGAPCNAPPWGTLTAVDANTGQQKWQVPLGEFAGFAGGPNLGGPISTAGGLTFIGASFDGYIRAFESRTGREVWKSKLPASARSTPMTYVHKGRQYVVIAAGGHDQKLGPLDDKVVAFALDAKAATAQDGKQPEQQSRAR